LKANSVPVVAATRPIGLQLLEMRVLNPEAIFTIIIFDFYDSFRFWFACANAGRFDCDPSPSSPRQQYLTIPIDKIQPGKFCFRIPPMADIASRMMLFFFVAAKWHLVVY
jgi:hypothetical protein